MRKTGGYITGMESLPDEEKEDVRRKLKELTEKHVRLQKEYDELADDYISLWKKETNFKQALPRHARGFY